MQRNKKKFSDGLESMFQRTLFEDNPQDNPMLFSKDSPADRSKAAHGKSFMDSLEMFLEETIQESIESKSEEMKDKGIESIKVAPGRSSRSKKPVIGLDLLIRSTMDGAEMSEPDKKRITFTFEKDKVEKLRQIADQERSRIRDIVDELVTNFIQNYSLKPS